MSENVAEDILGAGRGPNPGREREIALAEVQGIAGRNFDRAAATIELGFGRAGAKDHAVVAVAGMVAGGFPAPSLT